MGFKQADLVPLQNNNISPNYPPCKNLVAKAFSVVRGDTTAALKARLPADASIIDISISGPASDAATTAVLSIGTTATSTELVPSADVKGGGTFIRPTITGTNVMVLENTPLGSDISLFAKYAETGTASTVGGPWKVVVTYVR